MLLIANGSGKLTLSRRGLRPVASLWLPRPSPLPKVGEGSDFSLAPLGREG